jgi:predicted dehydrogenase
MSSASETSRREFLTRVSRGVAAVAVAPLLATGTRAQSGNQPQPAPAASGDPLPNDQRVGFALIGLGRLAVQQLIPAFRVCKRAKLAALVSGDMAKAQKLAQENGVTTEAVYDYKNFEHIRENKEVQVVWIVLPNSMHAEFTIRAARAGKHVLCEKPMEVSVAKCEQMIEACKAAKVKLMIGYRIQYEPMNRAMQRLVREQVFGPAKFIDASFSMKLTTPEWRVSKALSGSGAVGDIGIYCINTIRFLLGEEPIEIHAQSFRPADNPLFKEVDATTTWQMRFPGGVLANCMCSFDANSTAAYGIVANRGTFGMDPAFPYRGLKMFAKPEQPAPPQIAESDQFANELDHMADCVLQNREPYTPGDEGLQDMRIIEAILESAKTGRAVKLPKSDQLDAFRGPAPW